MSSTNLRLRSSGESQPITSRQFRHRTVTNAEYRAYATARYGTSDQEDCSSRELLKASSTLAGAATCRLICLRSAAGADSPPHPSPSAFRQQVVTSHALDPSAPLPHEYHQQAKQIPLTGVRFLSPAPRCPGRLPSRTEAAGSNHVSPTLGT